MADTSSGLSSSSQTSLSNETDEDQSYASNTDLAEEMAIDFNQFLNFNVDKEENKFSDSVELMLTKLDEFFSLVDMVRSDTSFCLGTTLPGIQAKCADLEAMFDRIDKLEAFVMMVKEHVAATEEKVTKAEGELGTMGGLVKKLTTFVSLKKAPLTSSARPRKSSYVPPPIFSTQEFFNPPKEEAAAIPSTSTEDKEASFTKGAEAMTLS